VLRRLLETSTTYFFSVPYFRTVAETNRANGKASCDELYPEAAVREQEGVPGDGY